MRRSNGATLGDDLELLPFRISRLCIRQSVVLYLGQNRNTGKYRFQS